MRYHWCVLVLLSVATAARGEVVTEKVPYEHDGTKLVGYVAYDDAVEGKRPGVLVVHEWWGLNDYARKRTEMLAELGYVAFAVDMYGDGQVTEHPAQAREWASQVRSNVESWRGRAAAGLDVLKKHERVDASKLGAIGYCFGGSTALELAFSGADLDAVVTFHGALVIPSEDDLERTKAALLVCHGAADPFIPEETAAQFREALGKGDVDWMMVYYSGARHSFTDPGAGKAGLDGLAYDKEADERSWRQMRAFFREKLGERRGGPRARAGAEQ